MDFGHAWGDFRTCLGHVWGIFWDMFRACFGHALDIFGTCVGHVLDMFGTCFEYVLDIFWTSFGHVLDKFWAKLGQVLGKIWAIFRTVFFAKVLLNYFRQPWLLIFSTSEGLLFGFLSCLSLLGITYFQDLRQCPYELHAIWVHQARLHKTVANAYSTKQIVEYMQYHLI